MAIDMIMVRAGGPHDVYLAHAGHWLVQVAYFAPVVLFLVWLGWTVIRDRRSGDGESPT